MEKKTSITLGQKVVMLTRDAAGMTFEDWHNKHREFTIHHYMYFRKNFLEVVGVLGLNVRKDLPVADWFFDDTFIQAA